MGLSPKGLVVVTVENHISTVASQQEGSGFEPGGWLWPFCVEFPILSGYSGFLPEAKDMQFRLTGDSKLLIGVDGCLYVSAVWLCKKVPGNFKKKKWNYPPFFQTVLPFRWNYMFMFSCFQ